MTFQPSKDMHIWITVNNQSTHHSTKAAPPHQKTGVCTGLRQNAWTQLTVAMFPPSEPHVNMIRNAESTDHTCTTQTPEQMTDQYCVSLAAKG